MIIHLMRIISWMAGIVILAGIIVYFGKPDFGSLWSTTGVLFGGAWILMTLLTRIILIDALVLPIQAMNKAISRSDAFWLGWARTFCNQIIPLSGLVFFAGFLKRRVSMTWGEVGALTSPQLLLAVQAAGFFGMITAVINYGLIRDSTWLLIGFFFLMVLSAAILNSGTVHNFAWLPHTIRMRLVTTRTALARLRQKPGLIPRLLVVQFVAVLLRALSLWLLFAAGGINMDVRLVLLLSALGEAALLFQITPGGIGLREGILIGAAALAGIETGTVASIAVLERALLILLVVFFALPSFWHLRKQLWRQV